MLAIRKHCGIVAGVNTNVEPKLAPPGAGLPRTELYMARLLFALRRWTSSRDSLNARFEQEREKIRRLVRCCEGDSGIRRVLIHRPRGLEDSSRYWSVWMTLDHLRIVNSQVLRVIGALTKGVRLDGIASTARVKPSPQVSAAVVAEYEQSCDAFLGAVGSAGNLKTALRYAHPWFGPLDAAGWHALAAGHMRIHRVQIERICLGLRGSA
jgi:hypothetical protein